MIFFALGRLDKLLAFYMKGLPTKCVIKSSALNLVAIKRAFKFLN